jgi:gliding motility-associated lipoprotein GldH
MKYLISLLTIASLFSCDQSRVFEDNVAIDGEFWHQDSLITLLFNIPENNLAYDVFVNVSNESNYPSYNLYFKYSLLDSVGTVLENELVNIDLFEPKTGKPLGSGLGDIFDHRQLLLDDYKFPNSGKYTISFQQYMRVDSLTNIRSMGVRIEKSVSQ